MPFDYTCHAVDATVADLHSSSVKDLVQLVVSEMLVYKAWERSLACDVCSHISTFSGLLVFLVGLRRGVFYRRFKPACLEGLIVGCGCFFEFSVTGQT